MTQGNSAPFTSTAVANATTSMTGAIVQCLDLTSHCVFMVSIVECACNWCIIIRDYYRVGVSNLGSHFPITFGTTIIKKK